jgi:predicted nucleic acid-binding protein
MNIILDACTIINLLNGQVLQDILSIPQIGIYIGDNFVDKEISLNLSQKIIVESLIDAQKIVLLESDITLSEFTQLKKRYDLGNGETECIALCKKHGYYVATDDWKARNAAAIELGDSKVIGSLFLLRETVRKKIISCSTAKQSYLLMKQRGGFLPKIDEEYFCK